MSKDYLEFIDGVKKTSGIDLSLYKEAQIKRRLTSFYEKKGFKDFREFLQAIVKDEQLYKEFLDRMTINVSEFYRNAKRWEVLQGKVLPELLKQNQNLKLWSAACSTGEEPYTLAMVMSNFKKFSEISISATDLDETVIENAKDGYYTERSLQEMPSEMKAKYLKKEGVLYKVDDAIKRTVKFKRHNLLADPFEKNFDLIICRNVMIYFTEEAKHQLYMKFSNALRPGGVLFVGSTEQIFNPDVYGFEAVDTFFYRKK